MPLTSQQHPQQHCLRYCHAGHCPLRVNRPTSSRGHKHCCEALPAGVAAGLALAFLPWSGCSQGGFYATGVEGTHGQGCQALYQPAAAAEQRFAARLKQQQNTTQLAATTAPGVQQAAAEPGSGASTADSSSSSGSSPKQELQDASAAGGQPQQPQLTAAEQLQQVPDAARDLVRDILREDNQKRTKQLVDDAWQTLE